MAAACCSAASMLTGVVLLPPGCFDRLAACAKISRAIDD